MNPRYMHEYNGSLKHKCKVIIGASICGQAEDALVHQRWKEARRADSTGVPPPFEEAEARLREAVEAAKCVGWHKGDVLFSDLDSLLAALTALRRENEELKAE